MKNIFIFLLLTVAIPAPLFSVYNYRHINQLDKQSEVKNICENDSWHTCQFLDRYMRDIIYDEHYLAASIKSRKKNAQNRIDNPANLSWEGPGTICVRVDELKELIIPILKNESPDSDSVDPDKLEREFDLIENLMAKKASAYHVSEYKKTTADSSKITPQ